MAIEKPVENEFGIDFEYHKIREVRIINDDKIGVQLVITVFSWADKKARIEGREPVKMQCIIDQADFAMTPFYALLKAKFPDFGNGKDDFDNSFKKVPEGTPQFFEQTAQGNLLKKWKESEPDTKPADEVKEEDQPEEKKAAESIEKVDQKDFIEKAENKVVLQDKDPEEAAEEKKEE